MKTPNQRVKITRDFIRSLKATGIYQGYSDVEPVGFGVKVSPAGTISYTYRWQKPDGKQGRKTLGHYPGMEPNQARNLARKQEKLIDKKRDTPAERLERKRMRCQVEREIDTQTVEEFIDNTYEPYFRKRSSWSKPRISNIKFAFREEIKLRLNDFDRSVVADTWRDKARQKGLSNSSINRYIMALRSVFSYAVEKKLIPSNPLFLIKELPEPAGRVRYLDDSEELALLQALEAREERKRRQRDNVNLWRAQRGYPALPDLREKHFTDHLKPLVILARETGLRRRELLLLQWRNVDLKVRTIIVQPETCKTQTPRRIPLSEVALDTLKHWRDQVPHESNDWIWPGRDGKHHLSDPKKAWQKVLKDAGIDDFLWRDLRHDFASRLAQEDANLNAIRDLMGHKSLNMTLRYAHLSPTYREQTIGLLDARRQRQTSGS